MITAAELLRRYPELYNLADARNDILLSYRQGALAGGERFKSGYSDPTCSKVSRLLDLSDIRETMAAVGRWIDDELPADNRQLLLNVWSGDSWPRIAQKEGATLFVVMLVWDTLTSNLEDFLRRCVGPACVAGGHACADGPNKSPRGQVLRAES